MTMLAESEKETDEMLPPPKQLAEAEKPTEPPTLAEAFPGDTERLQPQEPGVGAGVFGLLVGVPAEPPES